MKLFTATIAFLPRPNEPLMELTRRSTQSTLQFRELGPVVAYHAQDPPPAREFLCERTHPCMYADEIIEFHNGPDRGLIANWGVLLNAAFAKQEYDWALFSSNDVYWHRGAVDRIRELLEPNNYATYYVGFPTAVFLISAPLYWQMHPFWYDAYPPAGLDDIELACQVLAAGGEVSHHALDSLFDHPVLSNTGTMLNLDRKGERPSTAPGCAEIFARRWIPPMTFEPNSESVRWPPTAEQIAEIRKHPKRPD